VTQTSDAVPSADRDGSRWLQPTEFLDFDQPPVQAFAESTVGDATTDVDRAVRLFYAIRDGWWYDPYSTDHDRGSFRASTILDLDRSWCVPKSILLTAAARAVGVPARLGFADVRNHLQSEKLKQSMGTDLFVFHGYSEFLLDGVWRKASAAFNLKLCERFGTKPLEFDGTSDALLHEFDQSGNRHMEYVNQRGSYDDFPYEEMITTFAEVYGYDSLADTNEEGAVDRDTAFEPPSE
jgi:transglutaminase-like putative cysteine protease